MPSLNSQFEHELKKRLDLRMIEIAEILCNGQAVKDFGDYRKFVGEYQGLRQVAETFCDEVNTTINTR